MSMLQCPGASAQKPPSHAAPVMLHVRPLFVQPPSSRQAVPDALQVPATVGHSAVTPLVKQAAEVTEQAPGSVEHWLLSVQTLLEIVHRP